MSDETTLVDGIRAARHSNECRLVYADWLDDRGRSEEATKIRDQIALVQSEKPSIEEIANALRTLGQRPQLVESRGIVSGIVDATPDEIQAIDAYAYPACLQTVAVSDKPATALKSDALLGHRSTVEKLRLRSMDGDNSWMKSLADFPHTRSLDVDCIRAYIPGGMIPMGPECDLQPLFDSPIWGQLRRLGLHLSESKQQLALAESLRHAPQLEDLEVAFALDNVEFVNHIPRLDCLRMSMPISMELQTIDVPQLSQLSFRLEQRSPEDAGGGEAESSADAAVASLVARHRNLESLSIGEFYGGPAAVEALSEHPSLRFLELKGECTNPSSHRMLNGLMGIQSDLVEEAAFSLGVHQTDAVNMLMRLCRGTPNLRRLTLKNPLGWQVAAPSDRLECPRLESLAIANADPNWLDVLRDSAPLKWLSFELQEGDSEAVIEQFAPLPELEFLQLRWRNSSQWGKPNYRARDYRPEKPVDLSPLSNLKALRALHVDLDPAWYTFTERDPDLVVTDASSSSLAVRRRQLCELPPHPAFIRCDD